MASLHNTIKRINMTYDGIIDIATGASVEAKRWANRKISWSELVAKLTTETKTSYTHKDYRALPKAEQSKVKDVGGFVGGVIKGGKRTPQNILHKQLIALDLDEAYLGFWEDALCMFDNAMVIHSTHSHTPELPRYRLVIPLSRPATPEEYEATARYVAGCFGIQYFDDTTFQVNRLMFWPAMPLDIEFYSAYQDGPWLDVDEVLATYNNWHDILEWPRNQALEVSRNSAVDKQEDPRDKTGIIGAFCKAYSITEAIAEFIPEIYTPVDDTRYTFTKGSTAGGVIIYDDLFSFSHHGTDPTSGRLCNAFDLVRLHLYGQYDHNSKAKKDSSKKSFKRMEQLVMSDVKVKKQILTDNIDLDFGDLKWLDALDIDRGGKFINSSKNINAILDKDESLKGSFAYNRFDRKLYLLKSMLWRDIKEMEPIKDLDLAGVRNYVDVAYGIVSNSKIDDALHLEAERNAFHPIVDFLNSLSWDGVPRVDSLMTDYFGAPSNIYTIEASRIFLTAAIARVFEPGIKYDLVLTIVGSQGTGKSTFFRKLGRQWFSDTFSTFQGKESFEQLQGAWILEMAELSSMRRSEVEVVKQFISKTDDQFRPAYGRVVETYPRQCIFVGTTNESDFLQDPTGNRRFMPIDSDMSKATKSVFTDLCSESVKQIWAEAFTLYADGQVLMLSPEADKLAKVEQDKHSEHDDRTGLVIEYLDTLLPTTWDDMDIYDRRDYLLNPDLFTEAKFRRDYACVAEVWCECFSKNKDDMTRYNTRDINNILRRLPNWSQVKTTRRFNNYGTQKYFKRNEETI